MKERETGATATLGRAGYPKLRSATGGALDVVTGPNRAGFDPIDLLLASLAACISMSVRIAARQLGHGENFTATTVETRAHTSHGEFHRLEGITITVAIEGSLSPAEKLAIIDTAEAICTVSNALTPRPQIKLKATDPLEDGSDRL